MDVSRGNLELERNRLSSSIRNENDRLKAGRTSQGAALFLILPLE